MQDAGIDSARLDATVLLCHVTAKGRECVFTEADTQIDDKLLLKFNHLINRRCRKEPVAYLIGKKEFWSLDFRVTCDTLIPRPDSETLVEAVFDKAEAIASIKGISSSLLDIRIADIGTGTGCIIIAVMKGLPSAHGVSIDINRNTLNIARYNAAFHGVEDRITFAESNWLEHTEGTFDIIISNPPYIAKHEFDTLMDDVRNYEPEIALVSGEDGLDSYRAIAVQAGKRLREEGYILLETGKGQTTSVAEILEGQGFTIDGIRNDLAGIPRCVIARKTT